MGTYYSLACYDCKVFRFCGKVRPFERAALALAAVYHPEYHKDSDDLRAEVVKVDGIYAYPVTSNDLLNELARVYPHFSHPRDYKFPVERIAEEHQGHRLYIYSDMGHHEPWDFFVESNKNWMDWKQLYEEEDGEEPFHAYLPRNLVEDMGFRNWERAFMFINTLGFQPEIDMLEEVVKPEFYRLVDGLSR